MFHRMIDKISYIAQLAGLEILRVYFGNITLNTYRKIDQSPVTNADFFANQIIIHLLQRLTPNIPIVSEENHSQWKICRDYNYFWLIDPLDGTKEFLLHNDEFTVNIAFIEYGQPVMGVIYVPAYNILYAADNGHVWKIDSFGKRMNILVKSSKYPVVVVSRANICKDHRQLYSYLLNLGNHTVISVGSSLKFCLVAEGRAQFYPRFSHTKIWDTAAGHAIALASGAVINDWSGYPLHYKKINSCFLNPGFQVSAC